MQRQPLIPSKVDALTMVIAHAINDMIVTCKLEKHGNQRPSQAMPRVNRVAGEKMKKALPANLIREAILVFLMVIIGYGYFSSERDVNINSRLALVKAFVDEGRLEIDSYHNAELYTVDKSYYNGHFYSDKAIGASVLGIFAYYPVRWIYAHEGVRLTPRLFREWLTFLAVSLPTALIAPFLYVLIKQITASASRALIITLAVSLGTSLYKYGTAFYGHSLAAVFFFLAFLIWFYARQRKSVSLPLTFLSSFLLGFMVVTEYPTAVLVLLSSFYILFTLYQTGQLSNWRLYAIMAAGFIIPICIQLYYNNSIFGTPFTTGYSHEASETFKAAHANNFMGIGLPDLRIFLYQTFHPSLGIFWQSPILILALIGCFFMAKKEEYHIEIFFILGASILFILLISGYYMWWGGVAFTPRHLIPILPLFALPLAFVPEKASIPLLIAGLISIFQNLLMAASGYEGLPEYLNALLDGKLIPTYTGMLIYIVCLPNLINDQMMNNRGLQLLDLHGPLSLCPLLLLELGCLAVYFKLTYPVKSSKQNKKDHSADSV